jgi:toxin-antitoxin system PIN domain toxin
LPDLIDASVWLPLSAEGHPHRGSAARYWADDALDQLLFCRVTSLALLRLLTNQHVMREERLDGAAAWRALGTWLGLSNVSLQDEPRGIDEVLGHWSESLDIAGKHWTDAYLAAFAVASDSRLVSFDADFDRYPGLSWLHLEP